MPSMKNYCLNHSISHLFSFVLLGFCKTFCYHSLHNRQALITCVCTCHLPHALSLFFWLDFAYFRNGHAYIIRNCFSG